MKLPKRVEALLDADVFTQDELIDDTILYKLEFFLPQIIEAIGLVIAELKSQKRLEEINLWKLEKVELEAVRSDILMFIDRKAYSNADLREALVRSDDKVKEVYERMYKSKTKLTNLQGRVDEAEEKVWRYRNLQSNLDNIAKLRISERKY